MKFIKRKSQPDDYLAEMNWNIKSYNGYLRLNPDFNLSDISFFNQIFGNLDSIQCGSFFDLITYNPEG